MAVSRVGILNQLSSESSGSTTGIGCLVWSKHTRQIVKLQQKDVIKRKISHLTSDILHVKGKGKGKHTALRSNLASTHIPYGITQCYRYLPPGRGDITAFTPDEHGTRFSDPRGMQGGVTEVVDYRWFALTMTVTHPSFNQVQICGCGRQCYHYIKPGDLINCAYCHQINYNVTSSTATVTNS